MEKLKKNRSVLRAAITKLTNAVENGKDEQELEANYMILEKKGSMLENLDRDIYELMIEQDEDENDLLVEVEAAEEYSRKVNKAKIICTNLLKTMKENEIDSVRSSCSSVVPTLKRKFKLPMLELAKFGGNIRDWLSFWSMFQKIDTDSDIVDEDKFQYLIQATIPGSRARQLIDSFPPTANNYAKAVESLKSRFGREDLLIEMYTRELLGLIIQNLNAKLKLPLETLYDKIESQLRALESLQVTSDKCSAILYPLIESCLPEYLLRIWQRSGSCDRDASLKSQLDNLLVFLKKEVENEERVNLAVKSFDLDLNFGSTSKSSNYSKIHVKKEPLSKYVPRSSLSVNERNVPTAHDLVSHENNGVVSCIFCNDVNHKSENCFKAKNLPLKEKQTILKKNNACFSCLKTGHSFKRCRSNVRCQICQKRHLSLMCFKDHQQPNENPKSLTGDSRTSSTSVEPVGLSVENTLSNNSLLDVSLQTLVVVIRGEKCERRARALFDTGSQRSYILKSIAEEIGYTSMKREEIIHSLFGGSLSQPQSHNVYKVRVKNTNDSYACNFDVLDQDTICNAISPIKQGPWLDELKKYKVELNDFEKGPIELLIGADVAGKLMTGRNLILKNGLVALESLLGWTLMGKYPAICAQRTNCTMTVTTLLIKDFSISNLWNLDVLGIEDPIEKKTQQRLEQEAVEHFNKTVKINDDGRYEVEMPWLEEHPPLPSNYHISKRRLYKTVEKLREEGHYDGYCKVLETWEEEGVIEEIPDSTDSTSGHYLPHKAVIKPESTTPIRPVFDASAKEKGCPSLNDCLEKGANLIDLIPDLLIRFRLEKIGVISDIKKAFLQISLTENDRHFLKFLWIDKENKLKVYRHSRVVFGVTCSPFLLGSVINKHLETTLGAIIDKDLPYQESTIKKLMNSFYVDNCITSVSSTDELNSFMNESTDIFWDAKFDLRGWTYNCDAMQKENVAVLGLNWCTSEDVLSLRSELLNNKDLPKVTKRMILSITHSLFDPIGFSAPVTLFPKLLLQEMWSLKLGWDDEVNEDIKSRFLGWYSQLYVLNDLKIPRWFSGKPKDVTGWTLHIFCDASKLAYAACIFLRIESENETVVRLVQAKCRVAPTKNMTIPRLELMAALIGARLANMVCNALKPLKIPCCFWSDSSTVITWIKRSSQWNVFVRNRINEIIQLTERTAWRHVAGIDNPADVLSRGCSPSKLMKLKWWEGPLWLCYPEENWPQSHFICNEDEIEKEVLKTVHSTLTTNNETKETDWYYKYFSKFNQVVRLISWIKRFTNNCKTKESKLKGDLTVEELENGRNIVIKLIQQDSFNSNTDKSLKSLKVIETENGILRVETKIIQRTDTYDFKYPVILPEKHPVVKRLIYEKHVKNCHVGVQGLLSLLREDYWILRGRKAVSSIVKKCVVCQRFNGQVLKTVTTSLPENRVREAAVFEVTGLDFAGPIYLKEKSKAWICLFTCAVFRAVHFELVTSLSTPDFLLALRRFISRRGRPHVIYSDNATNFTATENLLKKLDWNKINTTCTSMQIKWIFIPPSAPWWGGWWERLIRILKGLFKKVLGRSSLKYEEVVTVLCDCEAVVNCRPLTYLSDNPNDLMPLTPACFLQEITETGTPDIDCLENIDFGRRFKHRQEVLKSLRKRFRNEYLGQLTEFSEKNTLKINNLKTGDLVFVTSENKSKLEWPLAKIEQLIPGRDQVVRLVKLRTSKGTLVRPLQKLCLLETIDWNERQSQENNDTTARRKRTVKRPTRLFDV